MSKLIIQSHGVNVHINTSEELGFKSAKTKVKIELEYINSGNPFKEGEDEFGYQERMKFVIEKLILSEKLLTDIDF